MLPTFGPRRQGLLSYRPIQSGRTGRAPCLSHVFQHFLPHSTGQTRSSKNCQGKRAVLEVFWSARYCGSNGAGAYQADAVQTGMTGITSEPMGGATQYWNCAHPFGNLTPSSNYSDSAILYIAEVGAQIPHYTFTVNQRFADKTRPENVAVPIALYLGRPAQI